MGSAAICANARPEIVVVGSGSVDPTHSPTRTFSVFSTDVSDEVIVTVARLRLSGLKPVGSAVSARSPSAVPLGVVVSQVWSELAVQGVARPKLSRTRRVWVSFESEGVLVNATPLPSTSSLWESRLKPTLTKPSSESPLIVTVKPIEPEYVPPSRPVRSGVRVTARGGAETLPEEGKSLTNGALAFDELQENELAPVF